MFSTILYILFWGLFTYCGLSALYVFILSLSGKLFYRAKYSGYSTEKCTQRIAILVPAYKEDTIIYPTADNLLNLDYPSELYDIYIIADSFQNETIEKLKQLRLNVMEVSFEKSTKAKSLNEAFKRISEFYNVALICDADNMLSKDFLKNLNNAFENGAKAIQGRRVAKNLDTQFAILDACSEGINNNVFRKGPSAMGLSSSVIGSGMAFDFRLIKEILSEIDVVGGFDKVLQLKVVEKGININYLEDLLIFDEKVSSSHAFGQQRKRWLSSQFIYLKQFFPKAIRQLFKGNVSYFNLAVLNNLILPRAFLIVLLPLFVLIAFFAYPASVVFALSFWMAYIIGLFIALPVDLMNRDLLRALYRLPKAIGVMVATLFRLKNANETFIHTVHTKTEINNSLLK
ncbi:MAG TPA: glycosyltransferase [Flavipsychrobacter sp.]|nr:glycosyltransferase [Flavipsychrobacter sp.]